MVFGISKFHILFTNIHAYFLLFGFSYVCHSIFTLFLFKNNVSISLAFFDEKIWCVVQFFSSSKKIVLQLTISNSQLITQ
jgi:hypothetical protein